MAAYQPKGAASLAASYINLAQPGTNNAAPGVAPDWATGTGWTFAGGTQYLTTGITPTGEYSMIVRFSGCTTDGNPSGHVVCGSAGTGANATRFYLRPRFLSTGFKYSLNYGADTSLLVGTISSGVFALAAANQYKDGAYIGNPGATTWSGTAYAIHIGVLYVNGAILTTSFFGGVIEALAIYSDTLTTTQIEALTTRMIAL